MASDTEAPIPVQDWGRDHWSTFAYIETRIVDANGYPDVRHMRCDPELHPLFAHHGSFYRKGEPPPTRLRVGERRHHDDWSCLDDAEEAGLLRNLGTDAHRKYEFTPEGVRVASLLRTFKATGGSFAAFSYEEHVPSP